MVKAENGIKVGKKDDGKKRGGKEQGLSPKLHSLPEFHASPFTNAVGGTLSESLAPVPILLVRGGRSKKDPSGSLFSSR